MRRALVLTDEAAGHPFLATLPPHVRRGAAPRPARPWLRLSREDWRSFFSAYIGSFVAVTIFFA